MKLNGWRIFCKDPNAAPDAPAPSDFDCKERLLNLRDFLLGYGEPRMLALFVLLFNNFVCLIQDL